MNKKLLTVGTAALFIVLFFAPQSIAIEEKEPITLKTQVYFMANITGEIELRNSSYPFFNVWNQLIAFGKGALWLVTAKMISGTIEPGYLPLFGIRNATIPDEYKSAELNIFRFKGTIDPIDKANNIYYVEGIVYWLVAHLEPADEPAE